MSGMASVSDVLELADKMEEAGSWEDVISLLSQRNRQKENIEIESRLVKVRHRAFKAEAHNPPGQGWPRPVADMFPGETGIPEIRAKELAAEVIASAIQHHGSLLVRGLMRPEDVALVHEAIDATIDARASVSDKMSEAAWPWYKPLKLAPYGSLSVDREIFSKLDTALAVDSPRTLFRHLEALDHAGFIDVVKEYFDEPVAISGRKSTIRRTAPEAPTGWHQDGNYFGLGSRSLNIWTAYSPCGADAPSLDVVAQPFEDILTSDGAEFYHKAVDHDSAVAFGEENIVRPVFDAGDALLFDHLTLHRTGVDNSMSKLRYAIEMWFFAASTYPDNQIPLLV